MIKASFSNSPIYDVPFYDASGHQREVRSNLNALFWEGRGKKRKLYLIRWCDVINPKNLLGD